MIDRSKARSGEVLLLERESHSNMYFVNGERILFYSDKLKFIDGKYVAGEPLTSLWDDILSNNLHNEGGINFPKGKKPEGLSSDVLIWQPSLATSFLILLLALERLGQSPTKWRVAGSWWSWASIVTPT